MNEKLRQINEVILEIQRNSILPLRLLDGPRMMENYLPGRYFSNAIHVYRLKGLEWLNKVFQKHIDNPTSSIPQENPSRARAGPDNYRGQGT